MNVNLIAAYDINCYGIGKDNKIPWHDKNDMKFFKKVTIGNGNNAVIMGRKTFESIGNKPLPNRLNIVLSKTLKTNKDFILKHTLEEAIDCCKTLKIESVFIIGGASIYKEALEKDIVDILYLNRIVSGLQTSDFDTFFPIEYLYGNWSKWRTAVPLERYYNTNIKEYSGLNIYYRLYKHNNDNDYNYLNLLTDILKNGETKHTRAGDTLSVFPKTIEFDLRKGLPILTTKKIYSKGCIHELLWFLKGGNNIKYLIDNDTHIWDDDAYRYYLELSKNQDKQYTKEEFLEAVKEQKTFAFKTDNEEILKYYVAGDLGPVYGKQWTDWNGINQIDELIYKLKNNPDDRRLMISAWNVGEIKNMALPPCHYLSQWYVNDIPHEDRVKLYQEQINSSYDIVPDSITEERLDEENIPKKYLSCMWQQRSVDSCLGLPYDILSYSIFLSLIAKVCNMIPYKLYGCLGDTHIYKNQIDNAVLQLHRNPYKYNNIVKLNLNENIDNIYDFKYEDIKIENYESYPFIKYILSVGL